MKTREHWANLIHSNYWRKLGVSSRIGLLLLMVLAGTAWGQTHRFRVHAEANLAVRAIAQGRGRMIYLLTSIGVYQFDGERFQRHAAFRGSKETRHFLDDGNGSIYFNNHEGIAVVRGDAYELVAPGAGPEFTLNQGKLVVAGKELVEVSKGGGREVLVKGQVRAPRFAADGTLWFLDQTGKIVWRKRAGGEAAIVARLETEWATVVGEGESTFWVGVGTRRTGYWDGRKLNVQEGTRRVPAGLEVAPAVVPGRSKPWILAGANVMTGDVSIGLPEAYLAYPITAAYEDGRRHLWLAMQGLGLVECIPDESFREWQPASFNGEPVTQVLKGPNGDMIAATQSHLRRLVGNQWVAWDEQPRLYHYLLAGKNGNWWASTRESGVIELDGRGRSIRAPEYPAIRNIHDNSRALALDGEGVLWVANKQTLLRLQENRLLPVALQAPEETEQDYPSDFAADGRGRLWVAHAHGISWKASGGEWTAIETDRRLPTLRSITVDPSGEDIWVAHRLEDGYSRVRWVNGKWRVATYNKENGYGPKTNMFIKRDRRGWIWRGTAQGLYVSQGNPAAAHDWLRLTREDGMANDDLSLYGFYEDGDGTVWVAGKGGVTQIRPRAEWFADPEGAPVVSGRTEESIQLATLGGNEFRNPKILYRYEGEANWRTAPRGEIPIRRWHPGKQEVEVAWNSETPKPVLRLDGGGIPWWYLGVLVLALGGAYAVSQSYWTRKMIFRIKSQFGTEPKDVDWNLVPVEGQLLGGRYAVEDQIAAGGTCQVYRGKDLHAPESTVAIKIWNVPAGDKSEVRAAFSQEVMALQSVTHPGVVPALDWGISQGELPFLVMPFLEGESLRQRINDSGTMTAAEVTEWLGQVGEALQALHERGLVHRDVKPENILLTEERAVLVDLGSAALGSINRSLSQTRSLTGSYHYLAPERLSGFYGAATDVYSLAVVLLEVLSGRLLLELKASYGDEDFQAELTRVLMVRQPAGVVKRVAPLLMDALNPNPKMRPTQVAEWSNKIVRALIEG